MNRSFLMLFFVVFFAFSCNHYVRIESEDYSLKIPQQTDFYPADTVKLDHNNLFSVLVYRKNLADYFGMDDCVAKELTYMLEGADSHNIVTNSKQIDGFPAVIIRGVNIKNGVRTYWLIAIIQTKYYYYIIRVLSGEKSFVINELAMEKIVNSFRLKRKAL